MTIISVVEQGKQQDVSWQHKILMSAECRDKSEAFQSTQNINNDGWAKADKQTGQNHTRM